MASIRRKRRLVLLLAILPLLAAVALFVAMAMDSSWERQNMLSPVAMFSFKIILICLVLLVPIVILFYRCDSRPHSPLRNLHRDEGGTAMVEMLLALPFMTVILLLLLQAVIMWQGSLTVHYAGYAATRAAITILNGVYGDEGRHLMFNDDDPLTPPSLKAVRICRAAKVALLPVCGRQPGSVSYNDPEMTGNEFASLVVQSIQNAPDADPDITAADKPWVRRLAEQFSYADHTLALSIRIPHHWNYPEPERGNRCPMRRSRRTDWTEWGYNHENYCPHYTHTFDFPHNEPIELTLGFPIPLEIPWANRILYLFSSEQGAATVQRMTMPDGQMIYYAPIVVKTEL